MSPVPVTYEPASNSAFVAIHGRRYHTETWSTAGFAIYGYYEAAAPGDPLDVRFTINSRETPLSFRASAQVTNAGDGLLAAKFMHLGERERRLLSSSGAAVPEIASAESSGTTEAAAVQPFVRRALRRLLIAAVYLLAGTAIIVFAVLAVLGHLMHVNVETAVISMALEQMISADAGVIAEMKVKPRMPIAAGQVLFRIDSEASARNIQAAREELAGAEIALRQAERRRDSESQRLRVYRNISNDQLEAAHANIAALTAAREEARAEFERQKKLIEHGLISRQLLDHQKSILAERQARVAQAVAEQRIAVTSADTTNAGLFFSGNFLVGDLAGAVAEETAARERVRVARTAVDHAIRQDARRLYRTPFDGIVMKVFKSTGMPVDRGEAVVVLRRANQDPWIDAWLTQDEASRIAAGARGVAVVAATERRYPVEIVSLDRTAGMLDRAQTSKLQQPAWMWRTPEDRSALARFAFIDLSDTERASIEPGSPVLVTVPKTRMFPMRLMQTVQASQEPAPRLWPAGSAIFRGGRVADPGFEPVRLRVIKAADAALRSSPAPVVTIRSAGVVDQSSTELQSSRRAFVDADNFVILALAAKLTGGSEYLDAARRIVSAWASVNQPTGHPIDEARLGGFLWGLDLLGPAARDTSVNAWLESWMRAKRNWKFGPNTAINNHKTHHLRILVMLDRLLGREADYAMDKSAAEQHLAANIAADGKSIDYQQRDAMHYHVLNLEAWLEIALVTGCCRERVGRAYGFFEHTLAADPARIEFAKTTAPIDRARAAAGFEYAQPHAYDPRKAARAIFTWATLTGTHAGVALWNIAAEGRQRDNLFHEARYYLWAPARWS